MSTRADDIYKILSTATADGRMKVSDVLKKLKGIEGNQGQNSAAVSVAVRYDNQARKGKGLPPRFKHSGDKNEAHGFIALLARDSLQASRKKILETPDEQIPLLIGEANLQAKKQLLGAIENMTWQDFESSFLVSILETLGFTEVEITKRSRDGGKDAICEYKRGIVRSRAIVSAKHWAKSGTNVPVEEVQRVRGIADEADTALIITSSGFSGPAKEEAKPKQGFRSVVLIDGGLVTDACFQAEIGIEVVPDTPKLSRFVGLPSYE